MKHPLRTVLAPAVLALIGFAGLAAAADYGDISITPENVLTAGRGHGYMEVAFLVVNRSRDATHTVRLVAPRRSYSPRGNFLRSVACTREVGPGSTVRLTLFLPDLPLAGDGVDVIIDGQSQEELLPLAIPSRSSSGYSYRYGPYGMAVTHPVTVLVSRSAVGFEAAAAAAGLGSGTRPATSVPGPGGLGGGIGVGSVPGPTYSYAPCESPATRVWSKSWLAYSSYDGVVLTAADFDRLPPEAQTALFQYVESGGSLLVLGPWKPPESWAGRGTQPVIDGTASTLALTNLMQYYPGYGHCIHCPTTEIAKLQRQDWDAIAASWRGSGQPFQAMQSPAQANERFPVVENISLPVRGLFVLMFVFVILIGPVNLYILNRKKKRLWLLWTVPAISFLTCSLVFGFMLVAEGWSGHSRTKAWTVLDETSRRAATIGWTAFYCPLVPGDGLHYSYETELTPQIVIDRYRGGGGTARSLDWTTDQHLAGGWLSPRTPAHFLVRKNEARRERVTAARGPDGALTAVNGLGAGIVRLRLADKNGNVYAADNIPAGGQAALRLVTDAHAGHDRGRMRAIYADDWLSATTLLKQDNSLLPGCYVAELDASPFLEEGLRRAKTRTARGVVYGIMREPVE